jgi:hypothetical protein
MPDRPTDVELAVAVLAAITEARESGVPDERIIEMLSDIVRGCAWGVLKNSLALQS